MRRAFSDEKGLLSLEASIALTIFIFIMLFMYSIFVIFEARNAIGHALLSAANILSLDGFAAGTLVDDYSSLQGVFNELYNSSIGNNQNFSDTTGWYEDESEVKSVARRRFVAYLAGGDEKEADKLLTQLNVVNGLDGLDFSASGVSSNQLTLVVQYKLEYEFKVFSISGVTIKQSCCSKMW